MGPWGPHPVNKNSRGKKWKQNPGWPTSPKIQPQTPSISKDWSFVVALLSECTITKMKCSKHPIHPPHSFLGGRIYFVSSCPFARKEKQIWPAENWIVLISSFMFVRRRKMSLCCWALRLPSVGRQVICTLQGENVAAAESRSQGSERGMRLNQGK